MQMQVIVDEAEADLKKSCLLENVYLRNVTWD